MKYYIIAGEASGDLHASNLLKELKTKDIEAKFRAWGGDLMQQQGAQIVKHYRELAIMGFWEVLTNIGTVMNNLSFCKKDIVEYQPDVLILVDYPGFNLRIAEFAHKQGIKVFYYISPKIWAWKKSRAKKIKKFVDKMFVIFPFEIDFYQKLGYPVEFVGNPAIDAIEQRKIKFPTKETFWKEHNLSEKPCIALLPGSRKQEIERLLPVMLNVIDFFPNFQFLLAAAPSLPPSFYTQYIENKNVKMIYDKTYETLNFSQAAIVASGTATLETALLGIPQVVCYKMAEISFQIIKLLVKISYVSLVNLLLNKLSVKEFIQHECNVENLKTELNSILFDKIYRTNMLKDYSELKKILGGTGASERSAEIMFKNLANYQLPAKEMTE